MNKVFLDTNILLDYGQERDDFLYAKAIMELGERGDIDLYASYLSYANMGYILRKYSKEEIWSLINDMHEGITVLDAKSSQLDMALSHTPVKDYEDLLQFQCALQGKCDVIVTNNKRDFEEFSSIPLFSSKEFLLFYFKHQ